VAVRRYSLNMASGVGQYSSLGEAKSRGRRPEVRGQGSAQDDPCWSRADRGQPITVVSVFKDRVQFDAASTLAEVRSDFSNYFWPRAEDAGCRRQGGRGQEWWIDRWDVGFMGYPKPMLTIEVAPIPEVGAARLLAMACAAMAAGVWLRRRPAAR
jgi:hypothetical protein